MKEAKYLVQMHPKWLEIDRSSAAKPAIVLSQKFGLSRNIKKYPFLENATVLEKETIYKDIFEAIKKVGVYSENDLVEMNLYTGSNIIEMLLFEKDLLPSQAMSRDYVRGVIAGIGDKAPIMLINTKNHLDMVSFCKIGDEERTLAKLNECDNVLGEELLYAYDSRLGFLAAKPEECGSGLWVETVVHLPGLVLIEEMTETLNALSVMGAMTQGLYNEKHDAWGAFFKVTVGSFSGLDEKGIIEKTREIQNALTVAETKARKRLFKEARLIMEDKIWRSFAMMKYARVMPLSQLFNFMSILRLGCEYKVLNVKMKILNILFERGFSANILLAAGEEANINSPDDVDIERADIFRFILKNMDS